MLFNSTYNVPANLLLTWLWSPGISLANPKSAILGWKSLSSKMLLDFISLCMIITWYCSCRYARPRAVPKMISNLCFQLRVPFFSPALCFHHGLQFSLRTTIYGNYLHTCDAWTSHIKKRNYIMGWLNINICNTSLKRMIISLRKRSVYLVGKWMNFSWNSVGRWSFIKKQYRSRIRIEDHQRYKRMKMHIISILHMPTSKEIMSF